MSECEKVNQHWRHLTICYKYLFFRFCFFSPVYSPDMPSRLPVQDIFSGLVTSIGTAIRYWCHYTLVAFAWLGVVPLTACESQKQTKSNSKQTEEPRTGFYRAVFTDALCLPARSHLQVFVYRLRELSSYPAIRYAFHVSVCP